MIVALLIASGVLAVAGVALGVYALAHRVADRVQRWRDWRAVRRQWEQQRDELRAQLPSRLSVSAVPSRRTPCPGAAGGPRKAESAQPAETTSTRPPRH